MKNKYVIVVPDVDCGGLIALQTLYNQLNRLGYNVKVFTTNRFNATGKFKYIMPFYQLYYQLKRLIKYNRTEKYKNYRKKHFPFVYKNTIVVYPEVIVGNPLHAEKVVRWLLYYNKNYFQDADGNTIGYDKNDLFFAYREVFNDEKLNPNYNMLYTPYYDLDLYKRVNYGERSGKCYVIRKGNSRLDLPKDFDGIVIDALSEKEKVEVLNKCEYCICYDTQTAYSRIAALCGCISVVVPECGKKRSDYLKGKDCGFGVAYGFDEKEIEYAKATIDKVEGLYKELNKQSAENVELFRDKCEEYFK